MAGSLKSSFPAIRYTIVIGQRVERNPRALALADRIRLLMASSSPLQIRQLNHRSTPAVRASEAAAPRLPTQDSDEPKEIREMSAAVAYIIYTVDASAVVGGR